MEQVYYVLDDTNRQHLGLKKSIKGQAVIQIKY